MERLNRMKVLVQQLREASKAYYQENREIITDREYDSLYDELAALESELGVQLTGSPTTNVGFEAVEGLEKIAHTVPLLSLDKTKDVEKLASFLAEHDGLLSWKLDGLTVALIYENGTLQQAITRGNGTVGEDVTHNARVFKNIPLRIPHTGRLSLRGEAVIAYSDFEKINESIAEPDDKYKNPRNLCSGTVRQLNNEIAAQRHVRFYAFGILESQTVDIGTLKSQQLSFLEQQGLKPQKRIW